MGRSAGFLLLLIVVGVGGYLYTKQATSVSPTGAAPTTTIDVTAVRNDLLAMANAEKRYWVSNSKYATLEELKTNGDIPVPSRANYAYSVAATENSFRIIALYSGSDPKAPRRITVDETMAMTTN